MADKTLNVRVKMKTDTSANWANAVNFVPLKGELIVYSDLKKIKIGDGQTNVNQLSFMTDKDTTYSAATQSAQGLMSATDKKKLDEISTAGSSTKPVYFSNGKPTEVGSSLAVSITGNAATATKATEATTATSATTATKLSANGGSANTPVYFSDGKPTAVTLSSTANNLLNALSTGSSNPTDNDYYIAQYAGGGTTTTTYHRKPVSALYNYIKGKTDQVYAKTDHTHSNFYNADISRTANTVLAAPNGSNGSAAFRKLVSADLPTHNHTKANITDFPTSLPASDVSAWAKAANKPSYSWEEISDKPASFTPSATIDGKRTFYATVASTDRYSYSSAAIEIRETNLVQNNQSDASYGPTLGFHWANRIGMSFRLKSDNKMWLWKSNNEIGTLVADLEGNASSASSVAWTNVSGRPTSLPASDVSTWAKAASKPSYSWSEITGTAPFASSSHSHSYLPLTGGTLTGSITISGTYYPAIYLATTNDNRKAYIEGGYDDKVSLWIDSDKSDNTKSRRGLVVYGFTKKADSMEAIALRQCDTSGTWLTDEYVYHTGNIKYYDSISSRPTSGVKGEICFVAV